MAHEPVHRFTPAPRNSAPIRNLIHDQGAVWEGPPPWAEAGAGWVGAARAGVQWTSDAEVSRAGYAPAFRLVPFAEARWPCGALASAEPSR